MLFLYILLKIFLKLLLLLIALIAAFLLIPFHYEFKINADEGMDFGFKIIWSRIIAVKGFFSNKEGKSIVLLIFNKSIRLPSKVKEKEDKKKIDKKKKKGTHSNNNRKIKEVLDKDFIHETIEYIKKITVILKPKNININMVYGFEDPFATGIASGFIYSIKSLFPNGNIVAYPCFEEETFKLDADLDGKICLGSLFVRTISYIFNKNVRKKLKIFKKSETFN